ncbi:GrpB family protein [Rhizobium sp. WSM4643]|uniref:GrpB family protein n=1 Tax=Rhizobium sp. WSM4643 TaxID=3138253 RepID=UPI0021A90A9B|nr:GrpB family protein [Rhizobium leguminosarum]UWM77512.1 GrpB family protein [Rhizobium leguminosarum bv. viciae]
MRIEIEEPRQSWVEDFATLKSAIMSAAPAGAYLHHIGSTAVPGLPAKNIIDIQLTVHDLADVDADAFEEAGFERRPIVIDHCPPGVDLAEGELRKAFYRSNGRPANLHIREKGRFNQRYSLLCRDFLRAHPIAGNAYALIKQRLAQRFPDDVDFYYDIKDPVFDIIMDGANDWAKLIGWSEPPGD